jgi:hypothetical protein
MFHTAVDVGRLTNVVAYPLFSSRIEKSIIANGQLQLVMLLF